LISFSEKNVIIRTLLIYTTKNEYGFSVITYTTYYVNFDLIKKEFAQTFFTNI